jgi:glycosyltransferase 2 family protein
MVVGIGALIGAFFLWLALRRVDFVNVLDAVSGAAIFPVVTVAACTLLFLVVKSWRWQRLLSPMTGERSVASLLPAVTLGSAANYLLPHVGELLRVWSMGRNRGASRSTVLTTIALERVFDAVAICLAGSSLLIFQAQSAHVHVAIQVLAVGCMICAVVIVMLLRYPQLFVAAVSALSQRHSPRFRHWFVEKSRDAIHGLEGIRHPRELAFILVLSILQWSCMAACVAASMWAIGLDTSVGASCAVLILIVVGLVLPSAPGYFGTTQLAYLMALSPLGYDGNSAVAASFIYNVVVVLGIVAAASLLLHKFPIVQLFDVVTRRLRGQQDGA